MRKFTFGYADYDIDFVDVKTVTITAKYTAFDSTVNSQTASFGLDIIDPCLQASVTPSDFTDQTYTMKEPQIDYQFDEFTIYPDVCDL